MGPSRRLDPLLTQERDSAVKRDSCTGTMIATEVHIRYDNEEMNIQQDQSMIRFIDEMLLRHSAYVIDAIPQMQGADAACVNVSMIPKWD
jgi:hypothetical protein